jgi:hypothetical protein
MVFLMSEWTTTTGFLISVEDNDYGVDKGESRVINSIHINDNDDGDDDGNDDEDDDDSIWASDGDHRSNSKTSSSQLFGDSQHISFYNLYSSLANALNCIFTETSGPFLRYGTEESESDNTNDDITRVVTLQSDPKEETTYVSFFASSFSFPHFFSSKEYQDSTPFAYHSSWVAQTKDNRESTEHEDFETQDETLYKDKGKEKQGWWSNPSSRNAVLRGGN